MQLDRAHRQRVADGRLWVARNGKRTITHDLYFTDEKKRTKAREEEKNGPGRRRTALIGSWLGSGTELCLVPRV